MMLITKPIRARLLRNGIDSKTTGEDDHWPVLKLFTPGKSITWLISEMDPDDNDKLFGLCDLGQGMPEIGFVRLSEITSVRGLFGLPVERDRHFTGCKPLSEYAADATAAQRITV